MKLKPFQLQDLARAALHDGLILGWDTGLGKTWALFLWPLLKLGWSNAPGGVRSRLAPNGSVLIVAPGDLHQQIAAEARAHFRLEVILLDSQSTFAEIMRRALSSRLPAGFYITSYTQLCANGVIDPPDPAQVPPEVIMEQFGLRRADAAVFFARRGERWRVSYQLLELCPASTAAELEAHYHSLSQATYQWYDPVAGSNRRALLGLAYDTLRHLCCSVPNPAWDDLEPSQQQFVLRAFVAERMTLLQQGLGEIRAYGERTVKCLYSPTLSDLCRDSFDCVVVDEGVKMKGADTLIGQGVRQMNPRYRLVLTATPVKNRLSDIFWLLWWATGAQAKAHARFPYSSDPEEQGQFADTFLVSERNLTKEQKAKVEDKKTRRFVKLTAQVCNVHRLWKLCAPIILRRRSQDIGEQIAPMTRHILRVPMGTAQASVYRYHLRAQYLDKNGLPAIGARMQALRVAAADPSSSLLEAKPGRQSGQPRSLYPYIPKIATALTLIDQILRRDEQVIVFSAFHGPLDILSRYLVECELLHTVLDGRTSQKSRGKFAERFQAGALPICLAGVESMAEGHNFWRCNNVIILAFSWAFDKFYQAIKRVHRLTSPKPVNLYCIICDGTMDRTLESSIQEKGDSAELCLDGKLLSEPNEEMNLAELLQIAEREFDPRAQTIAESALIEEWPRLRANLATAGLTWKGQPVQQSDRCTAIRSVWI